MSACSVVGRHLAHQPTACAQYITLALTNAWKKKHGFSFPMKWLFWCNGMALDVLCLVVSMQTALLEGGSRAGCNGLCFCHGVLTYCLSTMQYGKQTVPISSEEENHLKYLPEKDMQAIGFVGLDQIPRHMYMKVLCCLSACLLFVPQCQPIRTAATGDQINVNGLSAHLSLL